MREEVDLEVGLGLEEFAALVANTGAGGALAVHLAQVTAQGSATTEDVGTRFARVVSASRRTAQARAVVFTRVNKENLSQ